MCFSTVSVTRSANLGIATSDWPQRRGPERNGVSQEKGLLKQWQMTAGAAVFILALVSFGASWQVGIDAKTPGGLAPTGIFALMKLDVIEICATDY
jgi:hypothetical protein